MKDARLTRAQLDSLRRALLLKRRQLLRDLDVQRETSPEDVVDSAEIEDVAEGVIEDRVRQSMTERERTELEDVDRALAKMRAGTYGLCEASGQPIPVARLKAVPWARFAITAANLQEQRSR